MTKNEQASIRDALDGIAERNEGRLTPDDVVTAARNKQSVLHRFFEWDVKKAASEHWRDQARRLIADVEYVYTTETRTITSVAYIRDPSAVGKEQGYVSVSRLRGEEELAREAVVYEFARAAAALRRAREIAAILGLSEEVDAIIQRVDDVREKAFPEARA